MRVASVEVPAEVVGLIANQMVFAGIRDAWKLRGICTDFRDAITNDVLLYQTQDALKDGSVIVEHLMPRYLYYRVKKRLDVRDDLPVCWRLTPSHTVTIADRKCSASSQR